MLGRIFQAWQSGYRKANMVLGSVWGRGWAHIYSGLQSSDQRTQSPASGALSRAQTGLQALTVRAGQAEHPECSSHLGSSCLNIDFCQTVRNIRHHSTGILFRDRRSEGLGDYGRKKLGNVPNSKPPLLCFISYLSHFQFSHHGPVGSPPSSQYFLSERTQTAVSLTSAAFILP